MTREQTGILKTNKHVLDPEKRPEKGGGNSGKEALPGNLVTNGTGPTSKSGCQSVLQASKRGRKPKPKRVHQKNLVSQKLVQLCNRVIHARAVSFS
jgi:hypothetical protein